MPGKLQRSGKPYISIVGGNFSQAVDIGTPGSKLRKYELKDGTKGEKNEIVFTDWEGRVIDIKFEESKYGKNLNLELEDAVISINTASRYFQDLACRLCSADLSKPINFHPYDFEVDGQKKTGVSMTQQEAKLQNFFYDGKESLHGFPVPENRDSMDSDDWKMFFVKVKKFLIEKLEELEIPEPPKDLTPEDVEKAGTKESKAKVAEETEEVKIDDLPF